MRVQAPTGSIAEGRVTREHVLRDSATDPAAGRAPPRTSSAAPVTGLVGPVQFVRAEAGGYAEQRLEDLSDRLVDPAARSVVLDAARALERVPELLGLSPHILATARRPPPA